MKISSNVFEDLAESFLVRLSPTHGVLDLSVCTYASLGAVIKLIPLLYTAHWKLVEESAAFRIGFLPPRNEVLRFLYKLGFFSLVAIDEVFIGANEWARAEIEWNGRRSRGKRVAARNYPYMPLKRIVEGGASMSSERLHWEISSFTDAISEAFETILREHLGFADEQVYHFATINAEIYQNIYRHSGTWGYASIQCDSRGLVIGYGDIGVGFRESLEPYQSEITHRLQRGWNDHTALLAGFTPGITSKPHSLGFGYGLSEVRKFVVGNGGVVEARSGTGRVIFRDKKPVTLARVANIRGAQIIIYLPVKP